MSAPRRKATDPTECKSCRAPILWVTWPRSGKSMPVDDAPTEKGDLVLTYSQSQNKLWAEKFNQGQHAGRRRFISHFTTCPNAGDHRQSKA